MHYTKKDKIVINKVLVHFLFRKRKFTSLNSTFLQFLAALLWALSAGTALSLIYAMDTFQVSI